VEEGKFVVIPRVVQVTGFRGQRTLGSFMVSIMGHKGHAYGLEGSDFYGLISDQGNEIMDALGVDELNCHLTRAAARLMRMSIKTHGLVVEVRDGPGNLGFKDCEAVIRRG